MKYIYVAGPYTLGDTILNIKDAIRAADELVSFGYVPFIPHLSFAWHLVSPKSYDFWVEQDNAWLLKCDALIRLPGESLGADKEVELAMQHGTPVYIGMENFLERRVA